MFPLDAPPLTPDGDTARGWVTEELSRAEYGTGLTPLTRAIRWILQSLADAFGGGHTDTPIAVILLAAFAVFLVVLLLVVIANPVRLRARSGSSAVFDGEGSSWAETLEAATHAAQRGAWDEAVVWRFRALVLALARGGLVREAPGLTAREATTQAGARLADLEPGLTWAAALFDGVRYGTVHAREEDHRRLGALLDAVAAGTRTRAGAPPGVEALR